MRKTTKFLWRVFGLFSLLAGIGSAWYVLMPFAKLKSFADSLAADKTLELFTQGFYDDTRPIFIASALFFFALLFVLTAFAQKNLDLIENGLDGLRDFFPNLRKDQKDFWQRAKAYVFQDKDWLLLLGFILIGAILRAKLLHKPVYHDEAYTYLVFVRGGLGNIVSDYHQPNNHILYSILVFFSTHLFGYAPWVLRLPALLAGLLLIPATYFAARQAFNRATAILSSGIIALFPVFMTYSTSARGYAQLALLSTLIWLWAIMLLKYKNRYLWLLFVLTAVAGFYTIPIMLYPYTAMMAWLFFAWLFKKHSPEYSRKEFFLFLFLSGLVVVALFFLLYTPIFLRNGFSAVFNNVTIQKQQESDFYLLRDTLRSRGFRSWEEWHYGMPVWFSQLTLVGLFFGLLYNLLDKRNYPSYFSVSLLTFVSIILFQRSVGWKRVWYFFAPVYFSFTAAGIIYLLQLLLRRKMKWLYPCTLLLLASFALTSIPWWQSTSQEVREMRGEPGVLERGVIYLTPILTPSDAVLVNADYTPQMQYYVKYHGTPIEQAYPANNQFTSLYVILLSPDETVEDVLHSGTRDRVNLNASTLIHKDGDLRIYKVPIVVFYE